MSWGNIDAHAEGSGYDFSQASYDASPAATIHANLSLNQDVARYNLGAPWRMPTAAEFQELYDNCTNVWTTLNGVNGRLFTSNVNGNTLFFPAAGGYIGPTNNYRGLGGDYWSSTYNSATKAFILNFNDSGINPLLVKTRRQGFSVRPIISPSNRKLELSRLTVQETMSVSPTDVNMDIQHIRPIIDSDIQ